MAGSFAGFTIRLVLQRLSRRRTAFLTLLATTRRAAFAGLSIGALIFCALSRRSAHEESGDQMLGIQVGLFLAAMSCAIAGATRAHA